MAIARIVKTSMRQFVVDRLAEEISAGTHPQGAKLPAIKDLARRFDTSSFTISQALGALEKGGYLTRRNGVGVFVRTPRPQLKLSDTVVLCMHSRGHLYADLAQMLGSALQAQGRTPIVLDAATPPGRERLRQLACSGVETFFVQSTQNASTLFAEPMFRNKALIGFLQWEVERLPGQHLILANVEEGGRLVARYLHERGHRHVLVAVSGMHHVQRSNAAAHENPPRDARNQGTVFVETARELGCTVEIVSGVVDGGRYVYDTEALLAPLRRSEKPVTAMFGTMDTAAYHAREAIRAAQPELLDRIETVGFFNTPWSQAGHPPFTSVDLDLETLVQEAGILLRRLEQDPALPPVTRLVTPRLVERSLKGTMEPS